MAGLLLAWTPAPTAAQQLAGRSSFPPEVKSRLSPAQPQPPLVPLPEELQRESAIYLQRRLNHWSESDARQVLGEPVRHRDATGEGVVTGNILAYPDPTSRYREFELRFDKDAGTLRAVYIYPWHMTWDDCRDLWGDDVNITPVADNNTFRSYLSRRLDVLLDSKGQVISLGIY